MPRPLAASLLAALLALAGCVHVHEHEHHHGKRGGPPPWAPAHGYRHHHGGVDLVWDAHIGVYVVVGHRHAYFHDGWYFRRVGTRWERCKSWKQARWKVVEVDVVPVALVKYHAPRKAKHGKGRGHGPARHADD
jgi:hypothetical protein